MSSFEDYLRKTCVLLDGGLASLLEEMGLDITSSLWSSALLKENPTAIIEAHCRFLEAGAEILITSSYQASRRGFREEWGLDDDQADTLIRLSVTLAKSALELFRKREIEDCSPRFIAASIGLDLFTYTFRFYILKTID